MSQIPHDHPLPVLPVPTSSPPRPTTTSTSATLGSQYAPRDKDYEKHKAYSENGDEDDRDIKDDLGLPRASSVTERGLRLPPLAYGTSNHPHPRDKTPARRGSGLDYIVPLGEEKAEEKVCFLSRAHCIVIEFAGSLTSRASHVHIRSPNDLNRLSLLLIRNSKNVRTKVSYEIPRSSPWQTLLTKAHA
jgi:hypothetical protein